jgi:hypothetical protein
MRFGTTQKNARGNPPMDIAYFVTQYALHATNAKKTYSRIRVTAIFIIQKTPLFCTQRFK